MLPVALIEVLEEGMVLFRQVLSVYQTVDTAKDIQSIVNGIDSDEYRHHRNVFGEEVYLFILGRETIRRLLPDRLIVQDDIDKLVLYSIYVLLARGPSASAQTLLVNYGHTLGQSFQVELDEFADYADDYLSDTTGPFVLNDPVLTYIKTVDYVVPIPVQAIFDSLGVTSSRWESIVKAVKNTNLAERWLSLLETIPNKGVKPHKTQTFIGIILQGALSVRITPQEPIRFLSGVDGFYLSTNSLLSPEPLTVTRDKLSDDRGITQEMINSASIASMINRGYVQTQTKEWVPIELTKTVTDERDPDRIVYVKIAAPTDASYISGTGATNRDKALEGIEKVLSRVVRSHTQTMAEDIGKKALSKIQKYIKI